MCRKAVNQSILITSNNFFKNTVGKFDLMAFNGTSTWLRYLLLGCQSGSVILTINDGFLDQ